MLSILRNFLRSCSAIVALVVCPQLFSADSLPQSGEALFTAKCIRCHGPHGEGTKDHETPLTGELSVDQLADVIVETMPGDDPGTLADFEAQALAEYIHDAFYSPIAQARNRPARIALARLTVRQYRRAVADLIGSFRKPIQWTDDRGLDAAYFNNREPNRDKSLVAERHDPQIDFNFGTESPVPGIDDPRRYAIRWMGSIYAPETGTYEFTVRTEHAARLWINDLNDPIIDAWVKSGDDTDHTASLYFVGGQLYPLRLEFSKAKLGVDDSKKEDKKKEQPPSPPASIAFRWQPPQGVNEVVPARFLSPWQAAESFVCSVPFPPDDRSYGWERGTEVSPAWDEATTAGTIQAAAYVIEHLDKLAGSAKDVANRPKRLRAFCRRFALRAFRRPLDDEQLETYIDSQFNATDDADLATRRSIILILKSPRFLFREIEGGGDAYNTAARLAFGLWDSIPDPPLLAAARDGRLQTPEQVRQQAEWMLKDSRGRAKLHRFLLTWLNVDGEVDLSKDSAKFPAFDAATIADLRASLELFLNDVVWSDGSDYRNLLLSNELYVNDRLAATYVSSHLPDRLGSGESQAGSAGDAARAAAGTDGANLEKASPTAFTKLNIDDRHRAGVLTHPYIMARYSHTAETSPIHRGVFLARGILGQSLRPPPEAFTPLAPELHPDLTTRERVTLQTKDAACMSCHRVINPLGFTLEQFDAVGRYREAENGKPIDASTEFTSADGATHKLSGARDLAQYLAASDECHAAFVEQLFHHLVQQPVQAYGPTTLDDLRRSFTDQNFNIRRLALEIMVASAPKGRETNKTETTED